jgi:hypothetical protein
LGSGDHAEDVVEPSVEACAVDIGSWAVHQ